MLHNRPRPGRMEAGDLARKTLRVTFVSFVVCFFAFE